ncbi:MAG: intradiol ring-cleavage dioxygenase [Thermodesulfobacteriota bacterium]
MSATSERRRLRRMRRREAIVVLGGAGAGAAVLAVPALRRLASRALGGDPAWAQDCTPSPAQTEGPFYLADAPLRRNVTERLPGTPLWVSLKVVGAQACAPLPGALVEVWHADAAGSYSGFGAASDDDVMRGRQATGQAAVTTFRTIYPGWYPGRTPHIHVKVRVGGSDVHTGQLYFDEAVTDAVYAQQPYAARGPRDTTNATDGIFASGGAESMLVLRPRGAGYWGSLTLVVDA